MPDILLGHIAGNRTLPSWKIQVREEKTISNNKKYIKY